MSDVTNNNPLESAKLEENDATKLPETEIVNTTDDECAILAESVENILNSKAKIESKFEDEERRRLQGESYELHCPFYWQADLSIQSYGDHEIDCLSEFEEMAEETWFTLRRFITHLITCYHNFYKRLVEDSVKNMNEMERMLCRLTREESHDPLFSSIRDALLHTLYSCRVYMLEATNQSEEALQVREKIKLYRDMDEANQAAIWGIRAAVYVEYGYRAIKTAIEYMGTAITLDKGNPFWLFFKGLYLGRLRRIEENSTFLPEKEIVFLKAAVQKLKNPIFYSFTAETYLEVVELAEKKLEINQPQTKNIPSEKELSPMLDVFSKTAAKYFEKSVEMEESSAHLLFRYGLGLMRLRHPYQDLRKAKKLLQKGLEISPMSSYGNYAMALFITNHTKDSEAAELYLEKSAERNNFRAHIELCRKRLLEDESSVVPELEKLLAVYKEIPKMCKLYGELICCRLFVRYNLVKACNYARNLIDLQSSWINYIYEFNSEVFPLSKSVPLIELLVAEIKNRLQHERTGEVKRNAYKTFIHYILREEILIDQSTPKDVLERYSKEVEEGLQEQRHFLAVKADVKKDRILIEDRHRDRKRNSRNKEYYKYYVAQKNRSLSDIVPPDSLYENRRKKKGRESEDITQKYKYDVPQRCHSRSSSESSTNGGEALKCLTKGLESLAITETITPCEKKPDAPREGCSSSSSSDEISSKTSQNEEEHVDVEKKQTVRSRKEHQNRERKIHVSSSPDRKSVRVNRRDGNDESSCSSKLRSPYSSPKRKSSGSHCKDYHGRDRSSDNSSSRSSRGSSRSLKSGEPKFSHKYQGRDDKFRYSRKRYSSESLSSDGSINRHRHKSRDDRHREKSRRERSYSSDRSRHYRRHHDRNDHKRDRSRKRDHSNDRHYRDNHKRDRSWRRDHSNDRLHQKTYPRRRKDHSDRDTS